MTWTWHARGFACQFDAWRHESRECDSEFDDDRSHLRTADGLAAVCAAKPITLCEYDVSYPASGSHRDLEPGLSSGPPPVTKCEHAARLFQLGIHTQEAYIFGARFYPYERMPHGACLQALLRVLIERI